MSMKLTIKAGAHDRRNAPVVVALNSDVAAGSYALLGDSITLPCQVADTAQGKELVFILPELKAGAEAAFELGEAQPSETGLKLVKCSHGAPDPQCIDVFSGEKLLTTLHYGDIWTRPFLYPLNGPTGMSVTRGYPYIHDLPGETHDHHHQKSFWTAWGELTCKDLEKEDNWSESWKGHGFQRVRSCEIVEDGPVRGKIAIALDWVSKNDVKMMEEKRTYTIYQMPDGEQAIDVKVAFTMTEGDMTFGDTKEGGICAIRVASSMDASGKGTIVNSYGGIGEDETWGKRAEWCDYYGPLRDESVAGVTIMDNPSNFRFPTYWHVRNYGLMTANPFGTSYFYNDKERNGSHTVAKGQDFVFQYRVFVHSGTTQEAGVAGRYLDYVAPVAAVVD